MSTTRTPIDNERATAIYNSRVPVERAHAGKEEVLMSIQGKPTFITAAQQEAKTPGQKAYFDKHIYNLKANSSLATSRPEVKAILKAAVVAEMAGEADKASDLYNEWLNATQLSFNAIAREGVRVFEDGDSVKAKIGLVTTKEGHEALTVNEVKYVAPISIAKKKFSLTDLLGEEAPTSAVKKEAAVTA